MAVGYLVEPLGYEHVTGIVKPKGLPIIIKLKVSGYLGETGKDTTHHHRRGF